MAPMDEGTGSHFVADAPQIQSAPPISEAQPKPMLALRQPSDGGSSERLPAVPIADTVPPITAVASSAKTRMPRTRIDPSPPTGPPPPPEACARIGAKRIASAAREQRPGARFMPARQEQNPYRPRRHFGIQPHRASRFAADASLRTRILSPS